MEQDKKLYDLKKVLLSLPKSQHQSRSILKAVISFSSIRQDLALSARFIETFYRWHVEQVIPSRQGYADNGDEGVIGRAIFTSAATALARAFDDNSKGRNRIDFKSAASNSALSDDYKTFNAFRNTELAHYEGFQHHFGDRVRAFSDDRVVLVVTNDTNAHLTPVYSHINSSRELARCMISLIDWAIPLTDAAIEKKRLALFKQLNEDNHLKQFIKDNSSDLLFVPLNYWKDDVVDRMDFDPGDSAIETVDW